MATLQTVIQALVTLADTAMYPVQPSVIGASIVGVDVEVGRGYPTEVFLTAVLDSGRAMISVFPLDGERNTTRFEVTDTEIAAPAFGLGVVVIAAQNAITLTGVANANDVIGIEQTGKSYTLDLNAGDTAATVMQRIAAAANGVVQSGSIVFNVPTTIQTGTNGTTYKNLRSTERRVRYYVWSRDPATCDAISTALEGAISVTDFMSVGTYAEQVRLQYDGATYDDKPQDAGAYRRIISVRVDYTFTAFSSAYAIVHTSAILAGSGAATIPVRI